MVDYERILFITARQAPMGVASFSLPVPELLERGGFKRHELVEAVGGAALVHDWKVTLDIPSDRVLYERTSRDVTEPLVRMKHTKPVAHVAPPAAEIMDPVTVGQRAREYQDAKRKAGREVSATEAVAHITGQRGQ